MKSPKKLVERYSKSGIVLVLGSGVSSGCGLPTWKELLLRLAERPEVLQAPGRKICSALFEEGYSYPAVASILESRGGLHERFSDLIREELYRDFKYFPDGAYGEKKASFIASIQKDNPSLAAVAALCVRRELSKRFYEPNNKVRAIINFNLDSLLQDYTAARYDRQGGGRILRTIERPSASFVLSRTPVYHVHGYFRFDKRNFRNPEKEAPDLRVFTEQEYFYFYNKPTAYYNYTLLHLMREFSCIFLGASMRDDNMRRLLHYSVQEREGSYDRERLSRELVHAKSTRHFAILRRAGVPEVASLTEESLDRLGTKVIWIDDYEEIPQLLSELYTGAGDDWASVY